MYRRPDLTDHASDTHFLRPITMHNELNFPVGELTCGTVACSSDRPLRLLLKSSKSNAYPALFCFCFSAWETDVLVSLKIPADTR
jgi:hypothetical protein